MTKIDLGFSSRKFSDQMSDFARLVTVEVWRLGAIRLREGVFTGLAAAGFAVSLTSITFRVDSIACAVIVGPMIIGPGRNISARPILLGDEMLEGTSESGLELPERLQV